MCEHCKKRPASVYIRKHINGELEENYLCQTCAAKQGMPLLSIVNIDNYIANLMKSSDEAPEQSMQVCPQCGYKISMIKKTGRVGCAHCYEHYHDALKPIIRKIHGGRIHNREAVARNTVEDRKVESQGDQQIDKLKRELKTAIEKEEYERAAVLRDKIKELSVGGRL